MQYLACSLTTSRFSNMTSNYDVLVETWMFYGHFYSQGRRHPKVMRRIENLNTLQTCSSYLYPTFTIYIYIYIYIYLYMYRYVNLYNQIMCILPEILPEVKIMY